MLTINLPNISADPYFTTELKDQHVDLNSDVKLVCEARGKPDVTYTWYINSTQYDYIPSEQKERIKIETGLQSRLTIRGANYTDGGMYQCEASNSHSGRLSTAQLFVFSKFTVGYVNGLPHLDS